MLMVATPVGAMNKTFALSSDTFPYEKTFISAWYITFIKNDLPQPASPVTKIYNGSTNFNG